MAKIKCRWAEPYCEANRRGGNFDFGNRCFNFFGSAKECENFYAEEEGGACCNIGYDTYQIEKEVKSYELTDTALTMGRKTIWVEDMDELYIDGKEFKFGYRLDGFEGEKVINWLASDKESEEE